MSDSERLAPQEVEELLNIQRDLPKVARLIRERNRLLEIVEARQREIVQLLNEMVGTRSPRERANGATARRRRRR